MAQGNVFLAPSDPDLFDRTVRSPVDLGDHPDHPEALDGVEEVRLWGVRTGSNNRSYFEAMEPGDLVLFYQDDTFVGTGRIGITFEDEEGWASAAFWDDVPLSLVYTIDDFTPVSVPKAAVNRIFGYDASYTSQGLMRVADGRVENRPAVIERAMVKYSQKHA